MMDANPIQVREDVRSGKLPKWCWPLAAHGIYFAQRVLDDPGSRLGEESGMI